MCNAPDLYRRREQEARELAAEAADPHTKAILIEIAEGYAQLGGRAPVAPSTTMFKRTGSVPLRQPELRRFG